jgi:hypothetical protein
VVAAAALATRAPVVVAPAMNPAMLEEAAVQRNLEQLRDDGFYVIPTGPAREVAEPPAVRTINHGGAPGGERTAALALAVLASARRERPRRAVDWDEIHASTAEAFEPTADAELLALVREHAPPPGLLLDAGTGLGRLACDACDAGYAVVATDRSVIALARARAAARDRPITWLVDDVTASALQARFAVVVDRGCLHWLDEADAVGWAATVVRLVAPGGLVVVKVDAATAPAHRATRRWTAAQLVELTGGALAAVATVDGSLPAVAGPIPAVTHVLRRTGSPG